MLIFGSSFGSVGRSPRERAGSVGDFQGVKGRNAWPWKGQKDAWVDVKI
jgi:hypothetical protein